MMAQPTVLAFEVNDFVICCQLFVPLSFDVTLVARALPLLLYSTTSIHAPFVAVLLVLIWPVSIYADDGYIGISSYKRLAAGVCRRVDTEIAPDVFSKSSFMLFVPTALTLVSKLAAAEAVTDPTGMAHPLRRVADDPAAVPSIQRAAVVVAAVNAGASSNPPFGMRFCPESSYKKLVSVRDMFRSAMCYVVVLLASIVPVPVSTIPPDE
jgi:hypothetical protein